MSEEFKKFSIKDLRIAFEEAGYPLSDSTIRRLMYKGNLIVPRSTTNFKRAQGNRAAGATIQLTRAQIDDIVKAFLPGGVGYYDYHDHE